MSAAPACPECGKRLIDHWQCQSCRCYGHRAVRRAAGSVICLDCEATFVRHGLRWCNGCKRARPLAEFSKSEPRRCTSCRSKENRAAYQRRRETILENKRAAYQANIERERAAERDRYWRNVEAERERRREWRRRNIEHYRATQNRQRARRREQKRAEDRAYRAQHAEELAARARAYRQRQKLAAWWGRREQS